MADPTGLTRRMVITALPGTAPIRPAPAILLGPGPQGGSAAISSRCGGAGFEVEWPLGEPGKRNDDLPVPTWRDQGVRKPTGRLSGPSRGRMRLSAAVAASSAGSTGAGADRRWPGSW